MNATLHQLKWDFRRIRPLWIAWIVILLAGTFGSSYATTASGPHSALTQMIIFGKFVSTYLLGILLVARLMYSTPFTGASAFWKTRPLTQRSLFWTKTLMLLGLILAPVVLSQLAGWSLLNLGKRYMFWGTLHFGCLALAIFLLAAVWASLCEQLSSFWVCLASTGALLGVCAIIFAQLADRIQALPIIQGAGAPYAPTTAASTLITMVMIFLLTATAAWFLGALWKRRTVALATIAIGTALAASANSIWRTSFLKKTTSIDLPTMNVEAVVLDRDDSLGGGLQALWNQVAVRLPEKQTAQISTYQSTFTSPETGRSHASSSANWSQWEETHQRRLRAFYPVGTNLITGKSSYHSILMNGNIRGKSGNLAGNAHLTIYEWRRIASLPLRTGASGKHPDGGIIRVASLAGSEIQLTLIQPPRSLQTHATDDDTDWSNGSERITYVLYNEDSATAMIAPSGGYSGSGGRSLSLSKKSLSFGVQPHQLETLCGTNDFNEAGPLLRIDLFKPFPIAVSHVRFEKEQWTAYLDRDFEDLVASSTPKPVITKVPLPADPTAAQVEAYLDGVLFSIAASLTQEDWKRIEAELAAIGAEHFDRLLARMPVGDYADPVVSRVIRKIANEDHKPAMLEALRRDPGLARRFLELGWEADAAPVLAVHLRERRPLDFDAAFSTIKIVAQQADPATFDDLRWHFVHARTGHRPMAAVLKETPGFPFDETIAEAWAVARFDFRGRRQELAGLAVRTGDKEALREAFLKFATGEREADLKLLEEAVDHPGGSALPGWIHQNFDALTYDPATRKFGLE